jgi:hypothetical protein
MDSSQARRVIAAGMIGNVLEWYDFAIYGYFATAIGRHFFPHENAVAQLLSAFGVFAGAVPLFLLLNHPSALSAQLGQLGLVVIVGLFGGAQPSIMVEAAPLRVRLPTGCRFQRVKLARYVPETGCCDCKSWHLSRAKVFWPLGILMTPAAC